MKFIKISVLILSLMLTLTAIGQSDCEYKIDTIKILTNENLDAFLEKSQSDSLKISYDIKDIPSFLKKQLNCWSNDFSIANPTELFNETDIKKRELPDRKLLFLAFSENLLLMTYLRGGIGKQTHILFIKFNGSKIIDLWKGVCLKELKSKRETLDYIEESTSNQKKLNTNFIYF